MGAGRLRQTYGGPAREAWETLSPQEKVEFTARIFHLMTEYAQPDRVEGYQ